MLYAPECMWSESFEKIGHIPPSTFLVKMGKRGRTCVNCRREKKAGCGGLYRVPSCLVNVGAPRIPRSRLRRKKKKGLIPGSSLQ